MQRDAGKGVVAEKIKKLKFLGAIQKNMKTFPPPISIIYSLLE